MNLSGVIAGNRYRIERQIGQGGMATVWLATDAQHDRRVAIKTLHPELAGAIGTDRFLREIRLTAQLQHPGILPILDSGALEAGGTRIPWYAMPLLEGESLRSRLNRESQLPVDDALRIATAVGNALAAAHERGIVHRDIKPENVFLSGQHVYVVDFGVAKALASTDAEPLTSTGLAIGTPTYMSPEQTLAGAIDARSDQYSLAVILYEMLAGEPPFAGPNQQAVIARRLSERARPLATVRSTVPPAVERATLRALERTPADRFPTVSDFLAALEAPEPRTMDVRRWRRPLAALAGLVLLVAAGFGVRAMTSTPVPDPAVVALYRRGMQGYDRRTTAGAIEAAAAFSDAIRRDSSYAPAWIALAKTFVRAWERGFRLPDVPREGLLPRAVAAIDRALLLDEDNADAWTTKGVVLQQVNPADVATALRSVEHSLSLDSAQTSAWHFYAIMHANMGDLATAIAGWQRSVRIAPRYTQGLAFLALGHYWHGQYDSAAVWADSVVHVDPTYGLGAQTATLVEIERGNYVTAIDHAEAALRLAEDIEIVNSRANLALAKLRSGNRPMGMVDLLTAEAVSGGWKPLPAHSAVYLAEAQVASEQFDAAMATLGSYDTPRDMHFQLHLRCSPTFEALAPDARFRAILVIPRPEPGKHC